MKLALIVIVTFILLFGIFFVFGFSGGLVYAISGSIPSREDISVLDIFAFLIGALVVSGTHKYFNRAFHKLWDYLYDPKK